VESAAELAKRTERAELADRMKSWNWVSCPNMAK
jgi:hypothetical protein